MHLEWETGRFRGRLAVGIDGDRDRSDLPRVDWAHLDFYRVRRELEGVVVELDSEVGKRSVRRLVGESQVE